MTRFTPCRDALLLASCLFFSASAAAGGGYVIYRSDSPFEDVLIGLETAIQERGMYINNVMDIGEMLKRTGKDLGMDESIFEQAKSVEFCSALLSRQMTLEDPARVVNCPFIISVYRPAGETDTTYVVHREVPAEERAASAAMAKVATMLKGLSEEAVSW